jgi:hypothetical protein
MHKDTFKADILKDVVFKKRIYASKLQGSIFRHYGQQDTSGLCDGGDYIKQIQIRLDSENGDVYISIRPEERGEWWSGTISWQEFFDMMKQGIIGNDKFKHHTITTC